MAFEPMKKMPKISFEPFQVPQKTEEDKKIMSELIKRINQNARRIHFVEQKLERIENGMRGLDETMLTQLNELKLDLDRISNKITDIADRLTTMENEVGRINNRLDRTATKGEVKQLESFIDLINPITSQFVTKDELERAIENRLAKVKKRA